MKKELIILAGALLLVSGIAVLSAAAADFKPKAAKTAGQQDNPYAPGQCIVKFKSTGPRALTRSAKELFESGKSFAGSLADSSGSLDLINRQTGLTDVNPVFSQWHRSTTAGSLQAYQAAMETAKKNFSKRAARAAPGKDLPDLTNIYLLTFNTRDVQETKNRCAIYANDPHIDYAQLNYQMEFNWIPNDPYYHSSNSWGQGYDDLWALKTNRVNLEPAWDITKGKGVVAAVVDTGADYEHPDLADNIWVNPGEDLNKNGKVDPEDFNGIDDDKNGFIDDLRGWDFGMEDNDPMDLLGHGTHVSGTIAAVGDNSRGVIGVAPAAKIMALKAATDKGVLYLDDAAEAIVYAGQNGADVLNNSWGCTYNCIRLPLIEDAVRAAYKLGAVIVFSAGNQKDDVFYRSPQNMQETITVAATDHLDQRSDFSNFGDLIDLAAPGGESGPSSCNDHLSASILSLRAKNTDMYSGCPGKMVVGNDYYRARGTSMSSPHAVGLAALVLANRPDFTNEEVKQVLRISADDLGEPGFDLYYGAGRINAAKALTVNSVLRVFISRPEVGDTYRPKDEVLDIYGTAAGSPFKDYQLFYRLHGTNDNWITIAPSVSQPVENGLLGNWRIKDLPYNLYVLRLLATAVDGRQFETRTVIAFEDVRRIAQQDIQRRRADISGTKAAWLNLYDNPGLHVYDFLTNEEKIVWRSEWLFPEEGWLDYGGVAIDGTYAVWAANSKANRQNYDIYLYDFTTGKIRQITTDVSSQTFPDISGNLIVWKDSRHGSVENQDIYLYDLATGKEKRLTAESNVPWKQAHPAVSGGRIVWSEYKDGRSKIKLYDYITGQERTLMESAGYLGQPKISGDGVVWESAGNPIAITYYDLRTERSKRVVENADWLDSMFDGVPYDIDGNWLVFHQAPPVDDILAYYLPSGAKQRITNHPTTQLLPTISGRRVIWLDLRDSFMAAAIYLFDSLPQEPVLSPIGDKKISEHRPFTFEVKATHPEQKPLTLSMGAVPGYNYPGQHGATFTDHGDGSGMFSWPDPRRLGNDPETNYKAQFTVKDSLGLLDSEVVTITVTEKQPNRRPVFKPMERYTIRKGELLKFVLEATDPDNDPITLTAMNAPRGSTFVDHGNGTGTFAWTPDFTGIGMWAYFKAEDPSGLWDQLKVDIDIIENCLVGDVNDDGKIDNFDIDPFTKVLNDPAGATPKQRCAADVNRDGLANNLDIDPFVKLLTGQGQGTSGASLSSGFRRLLQALLVEPIQRLFGLLGR